MARNYVPRKSQVCHFLSVVGTGIGYLLGGVAIIEAVFTWPGLGSYVISAITARDLPVIQGFVIFSALTFVATTVLTDVLSLAKALNFMKASLKLRFHNTNPNFV